MAGGRSTGCPLARERPTSPGQISCPAAMCSWKAIGGPLTRSNPGFLSKKTLLRILGARVGDRLAVRIGADTLEVTVHSIRSVDWQSMRPNFFMVFPRAVLERFPGMYMTSFRLLPEQKPLLNQLVNVLPTVTVIELDIVIKEMRSVVDQVARALELVLGRYSDGGGGLVLISGVRSSLDGRLRESALLRAVGARRGAGAWRALDRVSRLRRLGGGPRQRRRRSGCLGVADPGI